jgi:transposase-like protein
MDEAMRQLRAEARRLAQGKPPSQVRYPEEFRRAAVRLAGRGQQHGRSVARLARAIGVSEPAQTKWLRPPAGAGLRPVAVPAALPAEAAAAVPSAVLITRQGLRVEGLDRDTLIAILRALG